MKENNPLSPHIQIYSWHVSSLVSISHRITGIVNYFLLIFICIWASSLFFGEGAYEIFKLFLNSITGKFFIISFESGSGVEEFPGLLQCDALVEERSEQ